MAKSRDMFLLENIEILYISINNEIQAVFPNGENFFDAQRVEGIENVIYGNGVIRNEQKVVKFQDHQSEIARRRDQIFKFDYLDETTTSFEQSRWGSPHILDGIFEYGWPVIGSGLECKSVNCFRLRQNPRSFAIDKGISTFIGSVRAIFSGFRSITSDSNRLIEFGGLSRHFANLPLHRSQLALHRFPLRLYFTKGLVGGANTDNADYYQNASEGDVYLVPPVLRYRHGGKFADKYGLLCIFGCWGMTCVLIWRGIDRLNDGLRFLGWTLIATGIAFDVLGCSIAWIGCLPWDWRRCLHDGQEHSQNEYLHGGEIVSQKDLTAYHLCNTFNLMANVLNAEKQTAIIGALAKGSSIRSIERITGVHRDTIMRLGVKVGHGCTALLDEKMRNLPCRLLQFDEVWGFIGKKERHCRPDDDPQYGDVWTFCAIDAETKLLPSFKCGKRNLATAKVFVADVQSRMANRVQISADALRAYQDAIEQTFGADVDFGQIIKTYEHDHTQHPELKYSAPRFVSVEKRSVTGSPDMDLVSTSYIERLNATTRLHMRRLTRLTLAFSKKFENFEAAVGLHFAYYNLVKRHGSLRMTPAMAAGIERDFWSVSDLLEAVA